MKNYVKIATVLGLSTAVLNAAGYKIPQQSLNSMALSAAYVAAADGADASYYNPANMMWMDEGHEIEVALTYIHVPSVTYTNTSGTLTEVSEKEGVILPNAHYVSPSYGDWRFGVSMVVPAGLTKRWEEPYSKSTAEEFGLTVIELNPNVAYKVSDRFAVGFGLRALYSSGVVKSDATGIGSPSGVRDLEGDSIDFGYNLALSYKPIENLTLATTYRSKVDLSIEGDAILANGAYEGGGSVSIPMPAVLSLAASYTINKTTLEFVYEKNYWSAYKELDFNYDVDLTGGPLASFDNPIDKNWKDSNTYRLGVTHKYSDDLKLMAGFGIDESPVPDETLGFETPDSDALLYSAGFEYKINSSMKMGIAYLYSDKDDRTVSRTAPNPDGTFTDSSAHLLTASFKYKF